MTVSQSIRYHKILGKFPELIDPSLRILELRCSETGIETLSNRPVSALRWPTGRAAGALVKNLRGNPTAIPVPDKSFDYVICVEVLEQLALDKRSVAIRELLRVARKQVLLVCACDDPARLGEQQLEKLKAATGVNAIGGPKNTTLPDVADIFDELVHTGQAFEIFPNENLLQHFAGVLLDEFFPAAAQINRRLHGIEPQAVPVAHNQWDLSYSYVFSISIAPHKKPTQPPTALHPAIVAKVSPAAKLYAVFHRNLPTSHLGEIIPIFAGGAAKFAASSQFTDILETGRTLPNNRWSELSAIYKLWREGPQSEVVGFCHYRRLFDFRTPASTERMTNITPANLPACSDHFYNIKALQALGDKSILVPPPLPLSSAAWQQYGKQHNIGDWCYILSLIAAEHQHLLPFAQQQLRRTDLYANNIFAMSWPLFDELCTLWFDLLLKFERHTEDRVCSTYQNRDISFLAERIFDLWLRYKQAEGITLHHLPIYFVSYEL